MSCWLRSHPLVSRSEDDHFLLDAVGRAWLAGVPMRWESLHAGRSASPRAAAYVSVREPAPLGRAVVARASRFVRIEPAMAARRADMRDWFWIPSWQRSLPLERFAAPASILKGQRWLVFIDDPAGAAGCSMACADEASTTVTVQAGDVFAALADSRKSGRMMREDYNRLLPKSRGRQRASIASSMAGASAFHCRERSTSTVRAASDLLQSVISRPGTGRRGRVKPLPILVLRRACTRAGHEVSIRVARCSGA